MTRIRDYVAFRLIGTPLEHPLRRLRALPERFDRRRSPEWNEVRDEGARIEELLRRVIGPDTNCIDVGCHLGSVLERMRRYAPRGQHLAFEPTPYKARWLSRRYREVDVRQIALSDRTGEAEFFYQPGHSGFSGLRSHQDETWNARTFRVQTLRLDDLVPPDRRIGFMKVDVEGAEPLVFRGGRRVLSQWHPDLLFECTLSGLALYRVTPKEVHRDLCGDLGYRIYLVRTWLEGGSALTEEEFVSAMGHPAQAFNFFASAIDPEARADR